jgi:ankyrin repeat protein
LHQVIIEIKLSINANAGQFCSLNERPFYIYSPFKPLNMEANQQAYFLDACRRGDAADVMKICELLPQLINKQDAKGFTPLIIAAYNDQPEIVSLLLKNGAAVDAQDAAGNTALMGASFKGYIKVAEQLLAAGADVNLCNTQGAPALTFAATFGRLEIARLLLENGAAITYADSRGKTSLAHALMQENDEMVALLQQYQGSRE